MTAADEGGAGRDLLEAERRAVDVLGAAEISGLSTTM
jgi:hypothetical protein